MSEFGALIRERRERKGIRAYDLAYAIGQAPSWLSRLEAGGLTHPPAPTVLNAISEQLDISVADLFEAMGYRVRPKPSASCAESSPAYDAADPREQLIARIRKMDTGHPRFAKRIDVLIAQIDEMQEGDRNGR